MSNGIPDRVGQWLVDANPPNAEQMLELVKLRLAWFHKKNNLNSDVYPPLYPFKETEIRDIASKSAGVRSLMQWCTKKFDSEDPGPKKQNFIDAYNELLNRVAVPQKEDARLVKIIACVIKMVPDGGTKNVVITKVDFFDSPSHDLHMIISGYNSLQKKEVKIGVKVSETTNGKTFVAVMERLLNYSRHKITRGCLVRSTSVPLSWKRGIELKNQLVEQQGGEVIVLQKNEIKPLVVIQKIYEEADNYGFNRDEVISFVKSLRLVADNPLICEILSAPE